MSNEGFRPVLSFDTDDPQFVRGFEAGRLWEQLKSGEPFEQEIHAANAELVLRMAESLDVTVTAEHLDDTWMLLVVGS